MHQAIYQELVVVARVGCTTVYSDVGLLAG